MNSIVRLNEYRTFGRLLSMGAYYSLIEFTYLGIDHQILVENTDFEMIEDDNV